MPDGTLLIYESSFESCFAVDEVRLLEKSKVASQGQQNEKSVNKHV